MPRGFKVCSSCSAKCGPRSFECKECGAAFVVNVEKKPRKPKVKRKIKPKAIRVVDWQNLKDGTRFKVCSGSGPYYQQGTQRIYMSERGYFNVYSLQHDGIWGIDKDGHTNFIYMGETKPSPTIPNLMREAHKIYVRE